jgi:hypothetical protein
MDEKTGPKDPQQSGPQNSNQPGSQNQQQSSQENLQQGGAQYAQQSGSQNPPPPGAPNAQQGSAQNPPDQYVLSYLTMRKAVGIIGCALPFVLALGKLLTDCPGLQSSISMYYYTDMRNVFVGSLCAIGIFMMSTRGYDWRDQLAGILASIFAFGVALCPTTPECDATCRQKVIGGMHLGFALMLFGTLAFFSLWLFTRTDPARGPMTKRKKTRNKVYRICGWTIVGCIILMIGAVTVVHFIPTLKPSFDWAKPIFWLESVAVIVFGISWLVKGETILKDN